MKQIATLTVNPAIDKSSSVSQVIGDKKLRCGGYPAPCDRAHRHGWNLFPLAACAGLDEKTIQGLQKTEVEYDNGIIGIIVKAESEAVFSPFALLVQMIAQEARAELHAAVSA